MADSTLTFLETVEAATSLKALDNTDGTYALAVGLVGAAGAALAKAEDSAHASGDPGIQALTVRRDTPGASAGTDGDYQAAITDSSGRLYARVPVSDSVLDQQKVEHRYVYKTSKRCER